MESRRPSRDLSPARGRENKLSRKRAFQAGGPPAPSGVGEEAEKKISKFLDRFASIRIPGNRKERPHLHLKNVHPSSAVVPSSDSPDVEEYSSKQLSEKEILALFEKMMEDMNLNEDRKAPLRGKDLITKKDMVMQYITTASKTGSLKSSRQISPQEFIHELRSGAADERLVAYLQSLRVSLTSNPVSWVESFGHEGLGLLLDILERLVDGKHHEKIEKKIQHKVVQCLKAFMNNKYGLERIMGEERSLLLLAKAIDPRQPNMMTDVVKLLSAICIVGDESILENVLEAITTTAEERNAERFFPIVEGLYDNSVQLQASCMQLINALVTSPDDLDFRLHIRNEIMRCGLKEILPQLKCVKNDALDIQLRVFDEHKEGDMTEFSHRLEDVRSEVDDANDVFNMLWNIVKDTGAEGYFLSILQHLLLIRNDYFVRPQYFKIIEECVSQIVLHRDGTDPDFTYRKRLDVDFGHLLDVCIDKAKTEEYEQTALELARKFEEEFTLRQEAQAQLQRKELKINELESELQTCKSQYGSAAVGSNVKLQVYPELPSVPLLETGCAPLLPPPPPPPPPPLLPPMIGVPPAPPLGFPGGHWSPPSHMLPFGLKPKKEFKPEVTLKRFNWLKIAPHEMSENCFWLIANDSKYEDIDLLHQLEHTFSCQKKAKKDEDLEEKICIKKRIKELKVLDPKVAQNLSIFLGSFRVPYEEIKRMILEVDETQLAESMIQNLIKCMPEQENLNALAKFKNEYNCLSEPEQFGIVMSSVRRLHPRLNAILFKLQFEEQVNNIKPDIMAVSTACEEIRKSKCFSKLLELVLLMGNYMNAGSRNAKTYGFNLNSLCKLKDTKSADQKTTLLHFLAEVCEVRFPDLMNFIEELQHIDKASKVSTENLEKSLKQMEKQLQQLERDLETFPPPENQHDKFVTKMSSFVVCVKDQYKKMSRMHENMEKLCQSLMEYYVIDPKKVSVEEFFTDLNNFKAMFMQAAKENTRRKEAEEKQRWVKLAKEKAEREKLERQQKKKRLLEKNREGDETGVIDSLLEALQSGAAFRDRRKRPPRPKDIQQNLSPSSQRPVLKACNHENQKAQLERSRSRHNINFNLTRAPTAKELNYNAETHSSTERGQTVEKETCNGEYSSIKGTESVSSISKTESVTEVEALLARLRAL